MIINGQKVKVFKEREPAKIGWGAAGAAVICESTGKFLEEKNCKDHIAGGAKKVIMSAPAKDSTPMFVMGVNHT